MILVLKSNLDFVAETLSFMVSSKNVNQFFFCIFIQEMLFLQGLFIWNIPHGQTARTQGNKWCEWTGLDLHLPQCVKTLDVRLAEQRHYSFSLQEDRAMEFHQLWLPMKALCQRITSRWILVKGSSKKNSLFLCSSRCSSHLSTMEQPIVYQIMLYMSFLEAKREDFALHIMCKYGHVFLLMVILWD